MRPLHPLSRRPPGNSSAMDYDNLAIKETTFVG